MTPSPLDCDALWQNVVKTNRELIAAQRGFVTATRSLIDDCADLQTFLSLQMNGSEWKFALQVARFLPTDQLALLLPDLVRLASFAHGMLDTVHDLILSLPKQLVIGAIEGYSSPIIAGGGQEEYRCFLELYGKLDKGLSRRLVAQALSSSDADIVEAGLDYQIKLGFATSDN